MQEVVQIVKSKVVKNGEGEHGPWTLTSITTNDGRTGATFQQVIDEEWVSAEFTENGEYNGKPKYNIKIHGKAKPPENNETKSSTPAKSSGSNVLTLACHIMSAELRGSMDGKFKAERLQEIINGIKECHE